MSEAELSPKEEMAKIQAEEGNEPEAKHDDEPTIEEQATDAGWHEDGKNMFGESVSAERFLQEKPLYNTIGKLKNTLGQLDTKIGAIEKRELATAKAFAEDKKALVEQLEAKREQAITDLDEPEIRRLNAEIKTEEAKPAPAVEEAKLDWEQPYNDFVRENPWFLNPAYKTSADMKADKFSLENPGHTPKELFDYVGREMKIEFPDLEKPVQEKRTSPVSSSNRRSGSSKTKERVKLTDFDYDEQQLYRNMADRMGVTTDEYLNPK